MAGRVNKMMCGFMRFKCVFRRPEHGFLVAGYSRVCQQLTQRRYFWSKSPVCGVKNARKVFNLAALFALHTRFLPQKTASPVNYRQTLLFCFNQILAV
ncbi:hypothetical protein, partial [Neisseria dentiae]